MRARRRARLIATTGWRASQQYHRSAELEWRPAIRSSSEDHLSCRDRIRARQCGHRGPVGARARGFRWGCVGGADTARMLMGAPGGVKWCARISAGRGGRSPTPAAALSWQATRSAGCAHLGIGRRERCLQSKQSTGGLRATTTYGGDRIAHASSATSACRASASASALCAVAWSTFFSGQPDGHHRRELYRVQGRSPRPAGSAASRSSTRRTAPSIATSMS